LVPLLYTWFYKAYGGVEELFIKAVSPLFAIVTILATYLLSKAIYKSKTKAWTSIFFLAAVPIFMIASEECLSDAPLMFYFTSSLYFLYTAITKNEKRNRAAIASGLLGGLAAFTKYTGLFLPLIALAIVIVEKYVIKKKKERLNFYAKPLILFIIVLVLVGAPWYIRNWITVGNPVYPHLYRFFGGKNIDPWLMENGFDAHFAKIRAMSGLDLSPISLFLTYFTVFFKLPAYEITDMGPFLGAFFLVGLHYILGKRRKGETFILTWAVVYLIVWRITISTFLRYLVAVLPVIAIISSHGLCELYSSLDNLHSTIHVFRQKLALKTVLKAFMFLLLLGGTFLPTMLNAVRGYKTWAYVSPFISRDEYMDVRFPEWWKAVNYFNQQTPSNAVILTYDHSIRYYVNRTIVFADEPQMKGLHLANTMSELVTILKHHNVTYIFDVKYYREVWVLQEKSYLYTNLENTHYFDKIFGEDYVSLYTIKA